MASVTEEQLKDGILRISKFWNKYHSPIPLTTFKKSIDNTTVQYYLIDKGYAEVYENCFTINGKPENGVCITIKGLWQVFSMKKKNVK